jgi:hypothetical protein
MLPRYSKASERQRLDVIKDSESHHRIGQRVRLTRCRTPRRSPISRSLARVDAKQRNGPALDRHGVALAVFANCVRYSPTHRRSRPVRPRSNPFPGERAGRCDRPTQSITKRNPSMLSISLCSLVSKNHPAASRAHVGKERRGRRADCCACPFDQSPGGRRAWSAPSSCAATRALGRLPVPSSRRGRTRAPTP